MSVNNSNQKSTSIAKWLIPANIFVIVAIVLFIYRDKISLYYNHPEIFKYKEGDKVYVTESYAADTSAYEIILYQLVRPSEKPTITTSGNYLSSDYYVKSLGYTVSKDSLRRLKTTCIGTYIGYAFLNERVGDRNHPELYYIIDEDTNIVRIEASTNSIEAYDKPDTYEEHSAPIYVEASTID
jgi:hypothetical protein